MTPDVAMSFWLGVLVGVIGCIAVECGLLLLVGRWLDYKYGRWGDLPSKRLPLRHTATDLNDHA